MLPLFISATTEIKDKHEKSKIINKEFSVNPTATLKIENSYGNIDVITWNENRIVFEITITTSGNDKDKIEKKLNEINVKFSASNDLVSAQTIFGKKSSNSWWSSGKNNVNMKINYVVKMPISGKVNLNNDYGNINLDKLEGKAEINCDYGKITTKELMADGNIFNFDYTNSKIEVSEDVNYNCDYGSIKIEKANNIVGNGDYLTTVIGDVYKNVTLKADYGSIKIDRMTENASNATITSDYTGIKIGYAPSYNFQFTIDLDYGSLRDSDNLTITKEIKDSSDKFYQGYYGNASSNNTITIDSDYGSITLFKN